VTVGGPSASGSFTLSATSVTVSDGSSGNSTITVTPENGYAGTIGWSVSTSVSLSNACYSISNVTVSGSSATTTTMTIYTTASACSSASMRGTKGKRRFIGASSMRSDNEPTLPMSPPQLVSFGLAIVFLAEILRRRPRVLCTYAGILVMVLSLGSIGCGSGSSSSSSDATKGTYTVTIVGTDTTSSITASTTMTLTID